MSDVDIRGSNESTTDARKPHKIILSENMKKQGFKTPPQRFRNYKQAYLYGISRWGSGSLEDHQSILEGKAKPKMGWAITR